MYDKTDLRSTLTSGAPAAARALGPETPYGHASYVHFKEGPPQEEDALCRKWYARGQNFLVCYVEAKAGAVIARAAQPDEYVVLMPEHASAAHIRSDHGSQDIPGYSIVIVPPGASSLTVKHDCSLYLLFTTRSGDLAAKAVNAETYAEPHHHVAPLVPWPEPPEGYRIRRYSLDVADEPGRFGRIWRCTTFMVNLFVEDRPRDVRKVSPHHHDDFEQGSLLMTGTMTHHLRWPWTTNMPNWLPDNHVDCGSPSLAVIPPPAIHTSNGTGKELRLLVDIFCPPRVDFSMKPGWILNAAEYPMPAEHTRAEASHA